jgi:hypothetical protein
MQLSASEQHCAMASRSEPSAPAVRDAAEAKQHEFSVADHSINPLIEEGVLQQVLGYVGPGSWFLMSLVSKGWRESYLQVEQQNLELGSQLAELNSEFAHEPRMTLLKATVASAAVIKLACDCGLPVGSRRLQFIAGRFGDVATLSAAFECGMLRSSYVCKGAVRGGCLAKLRWLVTDQNCPVTASISVAAAASGSVPVLDFLKQCGISFTVDTAYKAAAAGHQHVIEYLHAGGYPFDDTVYLAAAANGHVHVLQRLRELGCPWDSVLLCRRAASKGHVHALQWAKQQGAVFAEDTMVLAAGYGQTAVCEYLHAQQCPRDAVACFAAARRCHMGTLQWLLEHGYPFDDCVLWRAAAVRGHIAVMSYLLQVAPDASSDNFALTLFLAGASDQLAAAQWLRAHGAAWHHVLRVVVEGKRYQWEGAVLEWARAEGCTSPLE